MLHYMNGIDIGKSKRGAQRSSSAKKSGTVNRASRKKALKTFKGGLKKLSKMSPKEQLQYANALKKKHSPLNKLRVDKAIRSARKKELQIEQGEPFNVDMPAEPQAETFIDNEEDTAEAQGEEEVNEQEFDSESAPDSESEGEGMGNDVMIFPAQIGSKLSKAKKQSKIDKRGAKTEKTKSKGEATKIKAQAKLEKAQKGKSGKGAELLDKALDTAKGFGKGNKEESAPEQTWFEKNKMLVLGGGAVAGLALFMAMRKKK